MINNKWKDVKIQENSMSLIQGEEKECLNIKWNKDSHHLPWAKIWIVLMQEEE